MCEALSLELVLTMYNQKIVTFLSIRQINGQISSITCADQDIFPSGEGYCEIILFSGGQGWVRPRPIFCNSTLLI